jgi:hypothetical protein
MNEYAVSFRPKSNQMLTFSTSSRLSPARQCHLAVESLNAAFLRLPTTTDYYLVKDYARKDPTASVLASYDICNWPLEKRLAYGQNNFDARNWPRNIGKLNFIDPKLINDKTVLIGHFKLFNEPALHQQNLLTALCRYGQIESDKIWRERLRKKNKIRQAKIQKTEQPPETIKPLCEAYPHFFEQSAQDEFDFSLPAATSRLPQMQEASIQNYISGKITPNGILTQNVQIPITHWRNQWDNLRLFADHHGLYYYGTNPTPDGDDGHYFCKPLPDLGDEVLKHDVYGDAWRLIRVHMNSKQVRANFKGTKPVFAYEHRLSIVIPPKNLDAVQELILPHVTLRTAHPYTRDIDVRVARLKQAFYELLASPIDDKTKKEEKDFVW